MATLNMKWSEMNDDDLGYDEPATQFIHTDGDYSTTVAFEGAYKISTKKKLTYKPVQKSRLAMRCKNFMIENSKITSEMYKNTFDKEVYIELARYNNAKLDDDIDDAIDFRDAQPIWRDSVKEKFIQLKQLESEKNVDMMMSSSNKDESTVLSMLPPGGGQSKDLRKEDCIVRVTNLSEDATDADLSHLFSKCGDIERIYLARDKDTNKSKGYAFITYRNRSSAEIAIRDLDRHGHDNLLLRVEWAKPALRTRD